ncbi:MAG: hypothetical protein VB086_06625 [Clostridiaceae bacterium]|nr:hypothetical protein [Clostridiaceae bacterium]
MDDQKSKLAPAALNSFRGWLLVFLLVHVPLAFVNFSNGVYLLAAYLKSGAGLLMAVLSLLLCLLLPAALFFLLRRKGYFRVFYVLYCAVTAANYLLGQGISGATVVFTLLFTLPWLLYIFLSRRVRVVLANESPSPASSLEHDGTETEPIEEGADTQGGAQNDE